MAYNRSQAVEYAHQWAFRRNPRYLDFSKLGGDCTNFISQCLLAGGAEMNYTKNLGWYYNSASDRAPAWTGVPYLYNFLTTNKGKGPRAKDAPISEAEIGDIVQLSFDGASYSHSLIIVAAGTPLQLDTILIATHTDDSDYRPLSSYFSAQNFRLLKIL